MKIKIIKKDMSSPGQIELPAQFKESLREDLIRRAFASLRSHTRQPYGALPTAGKRQSAKLSRRRRDYKTSYGIGISRVPRKILSRSGTRFNWVGAFAPGTVGGRRAHPPKSSKIWDLKINDKERLKALRSALSATVQKTLVGGRGHKVPEAYPVALDDEFESVSKTKEFYTLLGSMGLGEELARSELKTIRAGKGKMRGRRYKKRTGPLVVVSQPCALLKSARNIPGIDVALVHHINIELLAPGGHPGRLTLFTKGSLEKIRKDKLFSEASA